MKTLGPPWVQWSCLAVGSFLLVGLLKWVGLPAALLLGPMLMAIGVATAGAGIRLPKIPHYVAQSVIGCMIAGAITPAIVGTFVHEWPLFLGVVGGVVLASSFLGWALGRLRIMEGTTAVWGLSPGGASAMMLMAEDYGADARLVAFMQYLRVVFVAVGASLMGRFWIPSGAAHHATNEWFPTLHGVWFAETLTIALVGGWLGRVLRVPAGGVLVPLILGAILHVAGWVHIELPPWLLAGCYTALGWSIGLGFTRQILGHALRALPQTILAILLLMTFCGGIAWILVRSMGTDALTAYLATSPGGMDSVAIIAASTKVDLPFVMAFQTVRILVVLFVGPTLARAVANGLQAGHSRATRSVEEKPLLEQVAEDEGELD